MILYKSKTTAHRLSLLRKMAKYCVVKIKDGIEGPKFHISKGIHEKHIDDLRILNEIINNKNNTLYSKALNDTPAYWVYSDHVYHKLHKNWKIPVKK